MTFYHNQQTPEIFYLEVLRFHFISIFLSLVVTEPCTLFDVNKLQEQWNKSSNGMKFLVHSSAIINQFFLCVFPITLKKYVLLEIGPAKKKGGGGRGAATA